jgi:hypothetical protein
LSGNITPRKEKSKNVCDGHIFLRLANPAFPFVQLDAAVVGIADSVTEFDGVITFDGFGVEGKSRIE